MNNVNLFQDYMEVIKVCIFQQLKWSSCIIIIGYGIYTPS